MDIDFLSNLFHFYLSILDILHLLQNHWFYLHDLKHIKIFVYFLIDFHLI
jgi:hypothetical protein